MTKTYTGEMVTGSDDPGKTKAEEDVDGVAAGDVADRVVCVLLVHSCGLAGEGVREGGAQGNECDGGDLKILGDEKIFSSDQTAPSRGSRNC